MSPIQQTYSLTKKNLISIYEIVIFYDNPLKNTKCQLISKCLFGVFNFIQKTNENKSTWGIIVVKSYSFVHFLEEFTPWQFAFEFYWPLVLKSSFKSRASYSGVRTVNILLVRLSPACKQVVKKLGIIFEKMKIKFSYTNI